MDQEVLLGPSKTGGEENQNPGKEVPVSVPLLPKEADLVKFEPKEPLLKDSIPEEEVKLEEPLLPKEKEIQSGPAVWQPSPSPPPPPQIQAQLEEKRKEKETQAEKSQEPIESKREAEKYSEDAVKLINNK